MIRQFVTVPPYNVQSPPPAVTQKATVLVESACDSRGGRHHVDAAARWWAIALATLTLTAPWLSRTFYSFWPIGERASDEDWTLGTLHALVGTLVGSVLAGALHEGVELGAVEGFKVGIS